MNTLLALMLARPAVRMSSSTARPAVRMSSSTARPLRVALLLGSTRDEGPPRPAPLGARVGAFVGAELAARGHECVVVDPRVERLELLRRPHFAYAPSKAPPQLERIAGTLRRADAFVCVTPEYNHAPGPALLNLLDHFGGSLFAFKPSAIVSYSAGQWGGTRAAHALRPILSELGCLPVSAMVHVPKAHEVFADEAGAPRRDAERWRAYAARALAQLEWWAGAARAHREVVDPTVASPALRGTPADRNAP